jgi:type I restriction enzyme S subunit
MPEAVSSILDDLVSAGQLEIGDGYRTKQSEHGRPGLPILRVAEVLDGRIEPKFEDFVSDAFRQAMGQKISRPGDIVLTTKGTVGRVVMMPADGPEFVYSPQVCYFRAKPTGPLLGQYLYYWFKSEQFWSQARSLKGQTDMADYINLADIRSLRIELPRKQRQQAIADVLGALDDKIAVNDRIVDVADALVRAWYTDYSLRAERVATIEKIALLVRDTLSANEMTGRENYIGLEHIPRHKMWLTEWEPSASVVSAKARFRRGDVLFGKLRPYFHKVGLALADGICSTDIFVVRPRQEFSRGWLLAALASDEVVTHASAVGDGTRMPRARWGDLATYEVPWPDAAYVAKFGEMVAQLAGRVGAACAENRALADLRDALLPGLMSGEIRVRDAEKAVEEAT